MSIHLSGPRKFIYKGDNKTHKFQLYSNGVVYDLTGATEITFTVKEDNSESASTIFTCTFTGSDLTKADAPNGKINVIVVPADTSGATSGRKIYYIRVTDAASNILHFGKGIYEIIRT